MVLFEMTLYSIISGRNFIENLKEIHYTLAFATFDSVLECFNCSLHIFVLKVTQS